MRKSVLGGSGRTSISVTNLGASNLQYPGGKKGWRGAERKPHFVANCFQFSQ